MTAFNLQSMTGFGRAQAETPLGFLSVELRSINTRFQDISVSLPSDLSLLESVLRALLKQEIPRGKVDCRVRLMAAEGQPGRVRINTALAREYATQLRQIGDGGTEVEVPLQVLTGLPGVIEMRPTDLDEQAAWDSLREVALQAIATLNQERAREGQALGEQLHGLMLQMRTMVDDIDARKDEIVQRYRERLAARLTELTADIKTQLDPGRMEMEVALFADRSDVSEELVRLRAHLARFESLIINKDGTPAGKNLDFLVQELNREVNTIGSKVRDTTVVGLTLEMKSVIERIREQVQNLQ